MRRAVGSDVTHRIKPPLGFSLLLSIALGACGGDDSDDASDDANDDAGSDDAGDSSSDPTADPTAADAESGGPSETAADSDDPTGSSACGVVPQMCRDFVAHLVECDPSQADLEDEAAEQCACDVAMYPDTPECDAAVEAFFVCASQMPCDMPEACLDAGLALAGACS